MKVIYESHPWKTSMKVVHDSHQWKSVMKVRHDSHTWKLSMKVIHDSPWQPDRDCKPFFGLFSWFLFLKVPLISWIMYTIAGLIFWWQLKLTKFKILFILTGHLYSYHKPHANIILFQLGYTISSNWKWTINLILLVFIQQSSNKTRN